MIPMNKRALVISALAAMIWIGTAADVCILAYINSDDITVGSSSHATARLTSGSTLIPVSGAFPIGNANVGCFEGLPAGEYEFVVNEPGFYVAKRTRTIDASGSTNVIIYLVPPTTGIVIVPHSLIEGFSFVFWTNLTLPAGTGITNEDDEPVTHVTPMDGQDPYLWGTLPMSIQNTPFRTLITGASAGTYRIYSESIHLSDLPGFYENAYNFSSYGPLSVSLYGGLDLENGHIGTFTSTLEQAYSWYIADIIVTKPSTYCSRYHIQPVDTYSVTFGFDQTDHGAGTFIHEECFDFTPAQLACHDVLFPNSVETLTCGAFGDPHILMFDGNGVTCGSDTLITLVDNEYISITADTRFLNGTNNATAIDAISLVYKSPCNPTSVRFGETSELEDLPFNSPHAFRHRARLEGNNIYIDAIHLRLQVRYSGGSVVFGISMPSSLVAASTGICVDSCRPGTRIDEVAVIGAKRDTAAVRTAMDVCTEAGLTSGSFEHNACVFDVASTSDTEFATNAATFTEVRSEVNTAWDAAAETPSGAPVAGSDPSTPTGASSSIAPASAALGALLAMILIVV